MAWMAAATVAGWLVTDSEQPLPSAPPQISSPRETFSQVFMAVNLSHFHHIYLHMGSVGGLLSGQRLDESRCVPIQTGNRDLGMEDTTGLRDGPRDGRVQGWRHRGPAARRFGVPSSPVTCSPLRSLSACAGRAGF